MAGFVLRTGGGTGRRSREGIDCGAAEPLIGRPLAFIASESFVIKPRLSGA
jgi:hypothetical protein